MDDRIRRQFVLDVALLALAAAAAVIGGSSAGLAPSVPWAAGLAATSLALVGYFGLYQFSFRPHFLDEARTIIAATAIAAMTITFIRVLVLDQPDAAAEAARGWLFSALYLIAGRAGTQLVENRRLRSGEAGLPTLIVGAGVVGRGLADRLLERPEFGLRPVAFLDDDPIESSGASADIPVLRSETEGEGVAGGDGWGPELEWAIEELGVAHVVVAFSLKSHRAELELVRRCQDLDIPVSLLPRLFESVPDQTSLERLGGMPLVSVHPEPPRSWRRSLKYGLDRGVALVGLVAASPLLLVAVVGTLLTLGRPVLFRQRRLGLDRREFDLLKIRTMRPRGETGPEHEAELEARLASGLAPGGVEDRDRQTRLGALLRRLGVDELPQLINVLRGEMSLVGPRPERPGFAARFDRSVYRYADRHRVKSGLTGWAQVNGLRGSTSLRDRVEWDNYYIENWSFWLDIKILLMTVVAVVRRSPEGH